MLILISLLLPLTLTTTLPTNTTTPNLLSTTALHTLTPTRFSCFSATEAYPIKQPECVPALNSIINDHDFTKQIHYAVSHYTLIKSWSKAPCTIILFHDGLTRPPPYDMEFSYQDVLQVALSVFRHCASRGHGGLTGVGKGYTVSLGNAIPQIVTGASLGAGSQCF